MFALIFSIGILVDDAIVVVENIVRHLRLRQNRGRSLSDVAVEAVDEVGNPTILATLAVICAVLPMAFVGGLTGPYMRPIPAGASAAMLFSLHCGVRRSALGGIETGEEPTQGVAAILGADRRLDHPGVSSVDEAAYRYPRRRWTLSWRRRWLAAGRDGVYPFSGYT